MDTAMFLEGATASIFTADNCAGTPVHIDFMARHYPGAFMLLARQRGTVDTQSLTLTDMFPLLTRPMLERVLVPAYAAESDSAVADLTRSIRGRVEDHMPVWEASAYMGLILTLHLPPQDDVFSDPTPFLDGSQLQAALSCLPAIESARAIAIARGEAPFPAIRCSGIIPRLAQSPDRVRVVEACGNAELRAIIMRIEHIAADLSEMHAPSKMLSAPSSLLPAAADIPGIKLGLARTDNGRFSVTLWWPPGVQTIRKLNKNITSTKAAILIYDESLSDISWAPGPLGPSDAPSDDWRSMFIFT